MNISKSPLFALIDIAGFPFPSIRTAAPPIPKAIPNNFTALTFSLPIKKENRRTMIGAHNISNEAFMGCVCFNPMKKHIWLMAEPNKPQANRRNRSFFSTLSLIKKKWMRLKNIKAVIILNNEAVSKRDGLFQFNDKINGEVSHGFDISYLHIVS